MDQLFLNELALGRISRVSTKPKCIHLIGHVPKKDLGKSCLITDCSRPPETPLNDYIKHCLESFLMSSIDTAVSVSTDNCLPGDGRPSFHLIVNSKASAACLVHMALLVMSALLIIDSALEFCAPSLF